MPRRFAGGVSPVTLADVVLTPAFARELTARLAASPDKPIFGAIVGRVFEDPACARRWVRADEARPLTRTLPEEAPVEELVEAIDTLRTAVTGGTVLGWFRSHHQAGLYLSPDEGRLHEGVFREPWEFALILAGAGERLAGGVFQRTDPEGLSRSVYTPFYELAEGPSARGAGGRATLITWANYQTDARIQRAGDPTAPRAVSTVPELTPKSTGSEERTDDAAAEPDKVVLPKRRKRLDPQVDGLPFLDAAGAAAPPGPRKGREPTPTETAAEKKAARDHEAEWEKIQIQRSLTAVGRSLGPGTIGQLGAPAPPEERTPPPASEDSRSHLTVMSGGRSGPSPSRTAAPTPADGVVIPIDAAKSSGGGVGASRRRRRLPVGRIAAAAAGLILVAGAGWVGARSLADSDASGGAAQAGLSMGADDLFGGSGDARSSAALERAIPASDADTGDPDASTSLDSVGADIDDAGDGTPGPGLGPEAPGAAGTDGETAAAAAPGSETVPSATSPAGADPSTGARPVPAISAPDRPSIDTSTLDEPVITDTSVTPYQNAISIFRTEITRYDETSRRFDEGQATCNPLNLAFRGLIDANRRLEARYAETEATLDDAARSAYRDAQRRYSVARTHYELTDCPMPVGG